MRITMIGTGYVGLVTGACLADLGHRVICLDIDEDRIDRLENGGLPIFEPGLAALVDRSIGADRLFFEKRYPSAIPGADVVFLSVGTPFSETGEADLSQIDAAVDTMAPHLDRDTVVVVKSTVPVGTNAEIESRLRTLRPDLEVPVVSNPEFLRQGNAVEDFMHPDRIVIGVDDEESERLLQRLYSPLLDQGVPLLSTNRETAELVKYASNAFLAMKLSFINEMADLCEETGASIDDIAAGMGMDDRISDRFLSAGPGFGGSCFPKDTQALLHTTHERGAPSRLVAASVQVNRNRFSRMADKIERMVGGTLDGKRIAVLGLTFKANTDDLRESPAVHIIEHLIARGAAVTAYDPQGMDRARAALPDIGYAGDVHAAAEDADALVIATEWPEFAALDLGRIRQRMASPVIVDLRNLFDPARVVAAGFRYDSIGRNR